MVKWRKWLPRWNRKQRIIRNLLCIALALFLMSWAMEFPSLTKAGLIRRAERQYLLAEDSTVLLETDSYGGGYELYLWNQGDILQIYYDCTLMGLWLDDARLFDEEFGAFGGIDLTVEKESGGCYPIRLFVFGDLEPAASAVLEVGIGERGSVYTAQGILAAENCWEFELNCRYDDFDDSQEAKEEREVFKGKREGYYQGTIWLYDEAGEIITSCPIEKFRRTTMQWG